MAPKKKEVQKFSLGEFIQDTTYGGSWADEVEDTYASGTQPLPPSDRRGGGGSSYNSGGYASLRDNLPQTLPTKPPYTAHLGNLSYDATIDTVTEFFEGCNCISVRIIEDREQNRPKGFAYAEFGDLEGLKQALTFDGQSFQGRNIRIKVADPPKDRMGGGGGESNRDLSDWTRKGPLADIPRANDRRGSGGDYAERRPLRDPAADDGKVRDFGNWERRGPLSPLPQAERPEGSRDGSRARTMDTRSESFRNRRASPSWGPGAGDGQQQEGSRPPRREFAERQERVVSAAEKDMQWRNSMRPDVTGKSPGQSREGSEAPPSPAPAAALPAGRPKLNLTKRTVSDAPNVTSPAPSSAADSKASPFGAARPIDTAAREREVAEKRLQAKKEAEEKVKEERRLAKEAAIKEAAEKEAAEKEAAEKAATEQETAENAAAENAAQQPSESADGAAEAVNENGEAAATSQDGEQRGPPRPRGEGAPAQKPSRAAESGNWRRGSGEQRGGSARGGHIPSGPRRGGGPPRGPRNDGGRPPRVNGSGSGPARQSQAPDAPPTPTTDEDGWTMVPGKGRRGQNSRAPISS